MLSKKGSSFVEPCPGADAQSKDDCEEGQRDLPKTFLWKSVIGFWVMGLLNNIIYVIMNAGAKSISAGGVGLVYACNIAPALLVKGTLPYWFHLVSYKTRIVLVAFLNAACLCLVGLSQELGVQLAGVVVGAFASSLGEASFLAYTSHFGSGRAQITAWSSGTGFAGIAGYAWIIFWEDAVKLSFSQVVLVGLVLPTMWLASYYHLIAEPLQHKIEQETEQTCGRDMEDPQDEDSGTTYEDSNFGSKQKFLFIITKLWPYMVPLFLVYWAEYAMQAGTWAAIGNPITSTASRDTYYSYLNWMYQVGVFISRSSGTFLSLNRWQLWLMPLLQIGFLVFFSMDALYHFWLNLGLLFPALLTGLLGGAVYVHAFLLISKEIAPERREFSLTAASIADTFGILLADVSGILIQGCIYAANEIVDCSNGSCSAPVYQCGHTFNTTFNAAFE